MFVSIQILKQERFELGNSNNLAFDGSFNVLKVDGESIKIIATCFAVIWSSDARQLTIPYVNISPNLNGCVTSKKKFSRDKTMTKGTCGTHCRVSQRKVAVQKTLEEARTSHLFDPKVSRQIRMDEAKFEKDHPGYLTGNG